VREIGFRIRYLINLARISTLMIQFNLFQH